MGLLSGGSKAKIPSAFKPAMSMLGGLGTAGFDIFKSGQELPFDVAGFGGAEQQALDYYSNVAGGGMLSGPGMQQAISSAAAPAAEAFRFATAPGIATQASMAGGLGRDVGGGSANQGFFQQTGLAERGLQRQLADITARIYGQERGFQQQAAGALGTMGGVQRGVQQAQLNIPQNRLRFQQEMLQGAINPYQAQFGAPTYQKSKMGLGQLALGAGTIAASMYGGPAAGAAVGSMGGGMMNPQGGPGSGAFRMPGFTGY